jgi:RNA polymerase sigma-70 factor (ECF subfamily)
MQSGSGDRRPGYEHADWPPAIAVIRLAVTGDDRSLSEILRGGYPRLVGFYLGVGLGRHEAEELSAETCEAVVTRIDGLRAPEAFEAWFWSIARNRLRTLFRRRRAAKPTDAMVSPATPEEISMEGDEHRRIRIALENLSPKDRELLWLREVEGLEYDDIARRLGATPGTVRVACHRARRRLEAAYLADE